jgi:hypothetical protein
LRLLTNLTPSYKTLNANHNAQAQALEGLGGGTNLQTCPVPFENSGHTHEEEEESEHQKYLSSEASTQLHHKPSSFEKISPTIEYGAYSVAMQA